jgi:hypothetical protein
VIFLPGCNNNSSVTYGKDPGQGVPFGLSAVCSMRPDVSKGIEEIIIQIASAGNG